MSAAVTVHIIGAGLSGLAAAVNLLQTGASIHLREAAKAAGGRCRSYFDRHLGMEIDNGNHLLLSGNQHALRFIKTIGAEDHLTQAAQARFPFIDLRVGARWTIAPSGGPLPLWLLSRQRRAPGARLRDHLELLKLIWDAGDAPLGQQMSCDGPLYENLTRPFLLAALNTDPAVASSALARQLLRDTLMKGAQACKPIIAREGLSRAFIDPALAHLRQNGATIAFSSRLRGVSFDADTASALHFQDGTIPLSRNDIVILALPPKAAQDLVPGLTTPDVFNAILNVHFATPAPANTPVMTGVLGAQTEWLFAYKDRLSVTISAANHLLEAPQEQLAKDIWTETAGIAALSGPMPPWRILRETRATFAATPEHNNRRPGARTAFSNLFLAGDWTATGLPATIESAIKSGVTAAAHARARMSADERTRAIPYPVPTPMDRANANHG